MKEKISYEKVDLLLVLPRTQNNGSLRQSLNDLDFREIRTGFDIADIVNALKTRVPDLLIADCNLPDGDVCRLVRDVRAHKIGTNPFLPIILTTWKPSVELVQAAIDAGADDLIVQPTSRGQLGSRIESLTFSRKPFVVTASYIGPDRRKQPRPGKQEVPLIEVPNTLKAKATGGTDMIRLQQEIDTVIRAVNRDKLQRNAAHLGYLVNQILPAYRNGQFDRQLARQLGELLATAEDISRRLVGTRYTHVAKLCQALLGVARRLAAARRGPATKDLALLPQLAASIGLAFEETPHTVEVAEEISETLARPPGQPRRAAGGG